MAFVGIRLCGHVWAFYLGAALIREGTCTGMGVFSSLSSMCLWVRGASI